MPRIPSLYNKISHLSESWSCAKSGQIWPFSASRQDLPRSVRLLRGNTAYIKDSLPSRFRFKPLVRNRPRGSPTLGLGLIGELAF